MSNYGSIKLTSSAVPRSVDYKVIPLGKTKTEFLISNFFAQFLIFKNNTVEKIEINQDDSYKGADVLMKINGRNIGVQLTRFTLHDLVQKQNISKRRSYELIELILSKVSIDFKLNVHLSFDKILNNEAPLNKKNLKESLGISTMLES